MQRRSFLTLIAAAPIAALAPWSKIVQQPQHGWFTVDGRHFLAQGANVWEFGTSRIDVYYNSEDMAGRPAWAVPIMLKEAEESRARSSAARGDLHSQRFDPARLPA